MFPTRRILESCLLIFLLSLSASSQGLAAGKSWSDRLADLGLRIGEQVESVQEFSFNKWDYLDRQHIVVYVAGDEPLLLTLETPCDGMGGNRVWVLNRKPGVLQRRDKVEVRHEGRTADSAEIKKIERLLPAAPQ